MVLLQATEHCSIGFRSIRIGLSQAATTHCFIMEAFACKTGSHHVSSGTIIIAVAASPCADPATLEAHVRCFWSTSCDSQHSSPMRPSRLQTPFASLGDPFAHSPFEPHDSRHGCFRQLHPTFLNVAPDAACKQFLTQVTHVRTKGDSLNFLKPSAAAPS